MKTSWAVGSALVLAVVAVGTWWWLQPRQPTSQRDSRPSLELVADGLPQEQMWRQDFTFADMDGDGVRDLVAAPPRKAKEPWPHIFLRKGDRWEQACANVPWGGFPDGQKYAYGDVAVADFDGDGILEIALAMHGAGLRILKSQQKSPCGPWTEWHDLPEQMLRFPSRAIVAADMNRDGRIDLVAISEAPPMEKKFKPRGVLVFFNEVPGWRSLHLPGSEGLFGDDIAVGEVNGDDIPDIAVGELLDSRAEYVWLGKGDDQWKPATKGLAEYFVAWSVQLVDLDGDGRDELVAGMGGAPLHKDAGPRIYRWDGSQWRNASQGLPQIAWVCGVTAADLDGDEQKELVVVDMYTGIVRVYKRSREWVWSELQQVTLQNAEGLRNYKVRTWKDDSTKQEQVVANFAGRNTGKILAWAWR